nr:penicillin acylase family protein [Kibdelosporangium sp. MJ126-NF4]CEL23017.1 Acyl-homoserine lactone acylase PvdQ, quorum-quenching [Kibdelosporangium sp. MJ126-NF4]CTQ90156.1 Acyl-homoserine lactone acylase PvdQ (EC 3.5.1.-), quorum-quenching [Kibdelosporangium sp. MJ126-NF4]
MNKHWGGLLLALGVLTTGLPAAAAPGGQETVIRRTSYGIPHVKAADYRGLGLGAGYAYAEDNVCALADLTVTLSGERSRWYGPDATTTSGGNNLVSDLHHQRVNQSRVIERSLAAPDGPSRQARDLIRGYAEGYNRYLARTGTANLPDATCRGAQWVRPISEIDIWRRILQVATFDGGESAMESLVSAQPPGSPVPPAAPRERPEDIGSNAIGLGKAATTAGTGMVLGNPHFLWQDDWRFYQQHLTIPGELDVSGAGMAGAPFVIIGHNDRMAWSHTTADARTTTVSKLALVPGDPTRYAVDGQVRRMTGEQVTVSARQSDGSVIPVTRTLYRTPEGPLYELPGPLEWTDSTAYVFRDANADNLRLVDQWLAIARSGSVRDVHASLVRHQGLPWVNTIASDSTGTTYYSDIQVVPHVTDEMLARCAPGQNPNIKRLVLDGSRASCDWGNDPDAVRPGLFGPGRLPSLVRQDHVSNMNNSPWLANPAQPLTGYPAIVGSVGTERSPRTRLGLDMIADRLDGSDGLGAPGFTLSTLQATMFGNRNLTAEQGRPAIVAMCRANPTLTATDGTPVDVRAACAALAAWDGTGETGERSRGAYFWRVYGNSGMRGPDMWRVPFDPADPVRTPRDINADNPRIKQVFANTVKAFAAAGVPVDLPLDAVQHYAGIPIHGCNGAEGCFNVINGPDSRVPVDQAPDVRHGSSFVMAAELTRTGPRMRSILIHSQSVNKASPHHTDQTLLHTRKQWVTGLFTDAEIARDPHHTVRVLR